LVNETSGEAAAGQRESGWLAEFYEKWVSPEISSRGAEQASEADSAWARLSEARTGMSEALAAGENEGSPYVTILREFAFAEAMYDRVIRRSTPATAAGGEGAAGRLDGFVDGFEAGFELAFYLATEGKG
jgi:hypothetical protein